MALALFGLVCFQSKALAGQERIRPTVPGGITATPVNCNQVDVRWTFSTDSGGSGLQGYYLYRGRKLLKEIYAPDTSFSDTGLVGSTTYSYSILAIDNAGNKSAKTPYVYATTPACALSCTYSVSPGTATIGSGAGSGTVTVTCGAGCGWTPSSSASWLTCTPANGSGGGSLTWSAAANTSTSPRSGTITISGQTFSVSQAGATVSCTYVISPTSANAGAAGASGTITVVADAGCSWSSGSSAPTWLSCSPASGTGSGAVTWSVAANGSCTPRSGTLTIAGQTFAVNQDGGSGTFSISPAGATPGAGAVSGTVSVTADPGCSWNASSSSSTWLSCSPASGTGSGVVTWSVTANSSCTARSSMLTVAGKVFAVNQAAGSGSFSISPASASIAATGGNGIVNVTATAGCYWIATSGTSWITISSGGTGTGTAVYSVAANTATSTRSASITVAGQPFLITQAAATVVDNPPTATLTAPGNGATISGNYTFSASASDDLGVSKVEFWCDGSLLLGTATAAPYSISYNTAGAANGTHTFTCKAFDTTGHSTMSASISATINNTTGTGTGGTLQWVRSTLAQYETHVSGVKADHSGNVVAVGSFHTVTDFGSGAISSVGTWDGFVAKYSTQGALLWVKRLGGIWEDYGQGVAIDSQDNIIVVGQFKGTADFGGGPITANGGSLDTDAFVAKYSPSGAHIWSKGWGSAATDNGNAVAVDTNNNVFVISRSGGAVNFGDGISLTGHGGYDVGLAKLSAAGTFLWAKLKGGSYSETPYGVAIDRTGDVVVTGCFGGGDLGGPALSGSGIFLAKYANADGSYRWARVMGSGTGAGYGVATDPATGNIYVTGGFPAPADFGAGTVNLGNGGGRTIFLAGYGSAGNYLWAKTWGGESLGDNDQGNAVDVDGTGTLVMTGQSGSMLDFAGTGIPLIGNGFFAASFSVSGSAPAYRWAEFARPSDSGAGNGVAFDNLGNVVIGGRFQGTTDFGGISANGGIGYNSGFVARYSK